MEKKPKYASLVDTITKSLYAVLVVNALLIALLNISILTNSIPAGSALLFTQTGPGVVPVDSFVLLEQTNDIKLLECIPVTPEGKEECRIIIGMGGTLPFTLPHTIGSGAIVGHKGDSTYILTAAHVCVDSAIEDNVTEPFTVELEFRNHKLKVAYRSQTSIHDSEGNKRRAEIVVADEVHDVCIMKVPGIWGLAIPIAESEPPPGTMVQNMAAPLGIWAPGMTLRFEGYFAGVDTHNDRNISIYTVPVAGGSSGSPVLFNGEIISIIVMSHRGFNHMGIGVRLEDIQAIMDSI